MGKQKIRNRPHATKRLKKYRSKFEATIHKQIPTWEYEKEKFYYKLSKTYTVDFLYDKYDPYDNTTFIAIETKGRFTSADRTKMLSVKYDYPHWDIRLVFQRDNYLYKGSTTKYSDWATKYGFKFAIGKIPTKWLKEFKK